MRETSLQRQHEERGITGEFRCSDIKETRLSLLMPQSLLQPLNSAKRHGSPSKSEPCKPDRESNLEGFGPDLRLELGLKPSRFITRARE